MEFIRRAWSSIVGLISSVDYSMDDYIYDRIRGLEREVQQLKDENSRAQPDDAQRDWRAAKQPQSTRIDSVILRSYGSKK